MIIKLRGGDILSKSTNNHLILFLFTGFNFIYGYLLQYILILYVLLYLYIAEAFSKTLDPSLDEGLLLPVLIGTIVVSLVYFSAIIYSNRFIWKRTQIKKIYFMVIVLVMFTTGILSNGEKLIGLLQ